MENRKLIKCEHGEIKNLTLEEAIEQFKFIKDTKSIFKWQWYFDKDDLEQLFYMGLIKTYNYYDITKGTSFIPIAQKIISREITIQYNKENKKMDTYKYISLHSCPKNSKDETLQLQDIIEDETIDIYKTVSNNDLSIRINKIINELSDEYKQFVNLYFDKQYTYREIADILNVSRQTVSNRIKKIQSILKDKFIKEDIRICY